MPTKRKRVARHLTQRVTQEALDAFVAGDYLALHKALGLKPWQPSPLPLEHFALGVDQDPPPDDDLSVWKAGWPAAQALQRELVKACRAAGLRARPSRNPRDFPRTSS